MPKHDGGNTEGFDIPLLFGLVSIEYPEPRKCKIQSRRITLPLALAARQKGHAPASRFQSINQTMNTITRFFLRQDVLSKLPILLLFGVFSLPLLLLRINEKVGLYFIAFYVSYWTVKVFESYYYILSSYFRLLHVDKQDYLQTKELQKDAKDLFHLVVVPIYSEPFEVIEDNIRSIMENDYPFKKNITVLLATEARGPGAVENAESIIAAYNGSHGITIVNVTHPDGLPDEGKVKGANITYAVQEYTRLYHPDPKRTFVSTIDTDTRVEKNFFIIVSYVFLTTDYHHHAIYQYTPIYSNNWHKGTFFARLIAMGTTFWQLSESQNPEFYRNFAVYGQSLYCLQKSDFWSKTSIVEDGLQYWRSYFAFDSVFRIVNVPAVCKMDVVEESNLFKTISSQYKQLRRWSWGCSDVEYVIPEFAKNDRIPTREKIRKTIYLLTNHLFWAGGAFMLFFIGYVPGAFEDLRNSMVSLMVPLSVSLIFTWIFATIVFPSILSILIMKKYAIFRKRDYVYNIFQWMLIPTLTLTLFSLPAIESQLRYFFGKRIDFFETTKKMGRKP